MAKQLNKKLVIGLTIGGMVLTTVAGIVMVATLPEKDPQYYVKQAEQAVREEQHAKASKLYARAWRVSNDPRYLIECGEEALQAGDAPLARKMWTDAIRSNPKLEGAHQKLVQLNLDIAKLARAVATWEQVNTAAEALLKVNPRNSLGLYARGLAKLGLRSVKDTYEKQGLDDLLEAQKLAPENPTYADSLAQYYEELARRHRADADKATAEAQQFEALGQREAAANKRDVARRAREEADRNFEEADRIYHNAVEVAARNAAAAQEPAASRPSAETPVVRAATARRNYGTFLLRRALVDDTIAEDRRKSCLDQGLVEITKAVELAPRDMDGYVALGNYWIQRQEAERRIAGAASRPVTTTRGILEENFRKAEAALVKAVEVAPNEYTNYLALGMLYNARGEPKRALAVYDQRLDRTVVRVSFMRWQDRHYKLVLLDQAFRTAMQQLTGRPEDKAADDALIAKAESYYRKAVAETQAGEGDPAALTMKGRLEAVRGNPREAIRALELAEKRLPTNHPALPEIRFALGDLYTRVGETGAAERALQQVVTELPGNDEAWARLASVLYANRNPRGVQAAEQALRINPDNRIALGVMLEVYTRDKNWEKAREIQKRLHAEGGEFSEAALLTQARQLLIEANAGEVRDRSKTEEAKRIFRQIVEKDPTNLRALSPLVQLLARDKEKEELTNRLNQALEAARRSTDKNRKELEQSIQLLSVSVSPDKTPEQIARATEELIRKGEYTTELDREMDFVQFYLRTADYKQALEHAKKASTLNPKDATLTDVLFRLALSNKDLELAKQTAQRAAEYNLDGAQGRFYNARYALATNDASRAIQELRAALDISGTNSYGQALLGRAFLAAGRYDEAQDALKKALDINPNSPLAILGMAQLAEFRNLPEAPEYLAKAKEFAPNDPWVQQKIAEEQESENPEQAIAAREKQRAAMPSDPEKLEPPHIANLLRLAALYAATKPPQYEKAEALYKEALEKVLKNERLQSRTVPWLYATFLRERGDKPDPERGRQVLKTYADALKDKDAKAAVELLIAQHMQAWAQLGLPKAPSRADIDAAYDAAVRVSDSFEVLMGTGTWYRQSQRIARAEEFYRRAIEKAGTDAEGRNREQVARRYLIDTLVQNRDPERRDEVDALIADYLKRYPEDPSGFLFQGQHYILTGRESEALGAYSRYIEKDPNGALAYYRRGYLWGRQEKWDAAISDLQKAKTLSPAGFDYEHRILLANCLLKKEQPDAAVTEVESIIREDPHAEGVARQLIGLYVTLQRFDQAETRALAFRQQFPNSPFWPFRLGQLTEERARRTNDPVRRAELLRTAGQYYRSAAEASKFAPDAVAQYLKTLLVTGQSDEAINYVTRTLPPDKRTFEHRILLANAYAKKGSPEQVAREFDEAAKAANGSPLGLRVVAESLPLTLGLEPAMKWAREHAAAAGNWTGKYMLAILQARNAEAAERQNRPEAAKTAYAEAEKNLREALAAAANQDDRLNMMRALAQFLYSRKQFDESCKLSMQIVEAAPNDVVTLNNLAYLLMTDLGKPKEAHEYAKRAAALAPTNANVLDTYGWNLCLLGKPAEAIGPLSIAIDLESENTLARYHRAIAYRKLSEAGKGDAEKLAEAARNDAKRAYDLAVQKKETDNIKLAADLLKELGITPPPAAPTAK